MATMPNQKPLSPLPYELVSHVRTAKPPVRHIRRSAIQSLAFLLMLPSSWILRSSEAIPSGRLLTLSQVLIYTNLLGLLIYPIISGSSSWPEDILLPKRRYAAVLRI